MHILWQRNDWKIKKKSIDVSNGLPTIHINMNHKNEILISMIAREFWSLFVPVDRDGLSPIFINNSIFLLQLLFFFFYDQYFKAPYR